MDNVEIVDEKVKKTMPLDTEKLTSKDLRKTISRFFGYMKPFMGAFIAGGIFAILHGAVAGVQPYFIKILMDDVLKTRDVQPLRWLLGLILLSAIFKAIFMYGQGYLISYAGQSAVKNLRDDVYAHLQSLSITFFERWQAGQIMYRVITDINLMIDTFTNSIPLLFADVTIFLFAMGMMIYLDWRMTLIAFLASPAIAYVMHYFGSLIQKHVSRMQNRISDLNSIMQENINGIKVIKSFGAEEFEKKRFSKINQKAFEAVMKSIQFKLTQTPLVEFIGTIGILIIIGSGSYLVSTGRFTIGELVSFIAYMLIATSPLNRSSNTYAELRKGLVSAARVFELLDITEKPKDKPDAVELEKVEGEIEFDNVQFAYDSQNPVLRGVSFKASPGEMIAIVGPNGAGKTTLVNLIPRFYEPTGGSIRLDGKDIRDVKVTSLRKHIGIVLQDTILFSGTIKDNISYGSPDAPDEKIEEAAKIANAYEFIQKLPDKFESKVGERGVGISGGQRQRISIARTILRDPEILILDEATSSLDQKSEAQVQEALEHLMQGRTTFVIAHRLSTITRADRIIVLDRGRVVESGTHKQLIKKDGIYKRLYEAQKTLEEEGGTVTGEPGVELADTRCLQG